MPLYYVAFTWISDSEPYWWPLNREVPDYYAKSLLPAITIGYVVPTVLMFIPWKDPNTIQIFEALWQPSPMFVPLLTVIFSIIYKLRKPKGVQHESPSASEEFQDLPELKRIYLVTGLLGVALHVYTLSKILTSSDPSFTLKSVFWPDFRAEPKMLGEGIRSLFMADFWAFYLASYVWLCSAVWDMKRVGRTTVDVAKASAAILLASFVIGPGATMSAVWYWREVIMAKTGFSKTVA